MQTRNLSLAVDHVTARPHARGWKYYDHATQRWYVATAQQLEILGALLAAETSDAYSQWCSEVPGTPL